MTLYLVYLIVEAGAALGPGPTPADFMPILWLELWLALITG